jgi:hypothetical protein
MQTSKIVKQQRTDVDTCWMGKTNNKTHVHTHTHTQQHALTHAHTHKL